MGGWSDEVSEPNTPTLQILSHRIERPGIIVENLPLERGRDILANVDRVDELVFARWVAVRIVRADEQMIIAGVFRQIRNIFVGFAGDVEPVLLEQFGA